MKSRARIRCVLVALVVVPAGSAAAQGAWQPDDRVVLTSFDRIVDLALGDGELYALADRGLLIMDVFARRWREPSTVEDGFPLMESPTAAAYDPVDRELWIGTRTGVLYTYQVDFHRWTRETDVDVGPIMRLLTFRGRGEEGVDVRTPRGWFRVSRFSGFAERLPQRALGAGHGRLETEPEELLAREDPGFAADRGTLLTDDRGRRARLTAYVRDDGTERYWLATDGAGLLSLDPRFLRAESHPFGTLTESITALARDGDDVWMAGGGRSPRQGVSRVAIDLGSTTHFETGGGRTPAGPFSDVLVAEDGVWFVTASGVYLLESSGEWRRPVGVRGIAARRLSVGPRGGAWAATEVGAYYLRPAGSEPVETPSLHTRRRVWTTLAVGDALWVVDDAGIRFFGPEPPPGSQGVPLADAPVGPMTELAATGSVVWGATADAVWRFDESGWEGPLREPVLEVGRVSRLRSFEGDLWVAGESGVARWSTESGDWRYLVVGDDIPVGPVHDVLVTDRHVWVATPMGAMRLDRRKAF